jgi:hypothetical protein
MWFCSSQRFDHIELLLDVLYKQQRKIMALVQVEQADLDALDVALDEATAAVLSRIDALIAAVPEPLPAAELSALQEDVEALRSLGAPAPTPVEPE